VPKVMWHIVTCCVCLAACAFQTAPRTAAEPSTYAPHSMSDILRRKTWQLPPRAALTCFACACRLRRASAARASVDSSPSAGGGSCDAGTQCSAAFSAQHKEEASTCRLGSHALT